jgi:adenylate cyclase
VTGARSQRDGAAAASDGAVASGDGVAPGNLSAEEVAERAGVSVGTLRRWVRAGAIPHYSGEWTPAASAHARIVAQLRKSGEPLDSIAAAAADGRLALGTADEIFQAETRTYTLKEAAKATGIKPKLIERIWMLLGLPAEGLDRISEPDMEALHHMAGTLEAGVPEAAFLQIVRVWAKAMADIADAEVSLIRMYVHEPLLRKNTPAEEVSAEMARVVGVGMPHIPALLGYMHNRYVQHFAETAQVQNVQADRIQTDQTDKLTITACFVDMAGFTRFTEEQGVEVAFGEVERLRTEVEKTLPDSARMIKMIGDGVMVVSSQSRDLVPWAVELVERKHSEPRLRVGMHTGEALYRDGDYYGSTPNMAARVLNRADGGEVLVTSAIREECRGGIGMRFASIGKVRMKGFNEPVELFRVEPRV